MFHDRIFENIDLKKGQTTVFMWFNQKLGKQNNKNIYL